MRYDNITKGIFVSRPNRFIAEVKTGGITELVHIKNTGRCRELLVPGCEVWLTETGNAGRKTRYDLVTVRKSTGALFNIDSQAPNKLVAEWLAGQGFDRVIPEYRYGASRIDLCMERGSERILMEVKGCTLEIDGTGYFPDAPTERGIKHIRELIGAKNSGLRAILAFVIQTEGVTEVRANASAHPEFAEALEEARKAGVEVISLPCRIKPDEIAITGGIRI